MADITQAEQHGAYITPSKRYKDKGSNVYAEEIAVDRKDKLSLVNDADANATGIKLSYLPPTGKTARLTYFSVFINAGTPTIQLQYVRATVTHVIESLTTSTGKLVNIAVQDTDTIQLNVTVVGGAGSTIDATMSFDELA